MFFRLAAKNARRSIKDYAVYFITLTLSVCIFYMFNSLDAQMVMLDIGASSLAENMGLIIGVISVFISVVLAFLIIYANNYIMRRRKSEIGLYMLLGFSSRKTAGMLVVETLLIGLLALATGLAAGYLGSQGMSVLTARMFDVQIRNYRFVFSMDALIKTCVYFGVMFLVVLLFTAGSVARQPLSALLGSAQKNEKLRARRRWAGWLLLLAGLALVAASYWLVLGTSMSAFVFLFGPALLVNFIGTLLLFYGMSGLITAAPGRVKRRSLRGLRAFTERQLLSRVNTNAVSMTFICTMIFLTLVIVSSVSSLNAILSRQFEEQTPVDVSVTAYLEDGGVPVGTIQDHLTEHGVDGVMFSASVEFPVRGTDVRQGEVAHPDSSFSAEARHTFAETLLEGVAVSDFNALLALQGRAPINLPAGTYALNTGSEQADAFLEGVQSQQIDVGGAVLTSADLPPERLALWTSGSNSAGIHLILPDEVAERLPITLDVFCADYAVDADVGDQRMASYMAYTGASDPAAGRTQPLYRVAIASEVRSDVQMTTVSMVYVGLYIGMVFLVAGAAILALQQLSGASDDRPRYGLLSRLGAGLQMINRALLSQTAAYFLLPLAIGAVHATAGIYFMTQVIGAIGAVDIAAGAVSAALFICAIYGVYFLATYFGERRIIWSGRRRQE